MRTKPFTFKKTVKTVKSFSGLEVNLLPEEAKFLAEVISDATDTSYEPGTKVEEAMYELKLKLAAFATEHGHAPDLTPIGAPRLFKRGENGDKFCLVMDVQQAADLRHILGNIGGYTGSVRDFREEFETPTYYALQDFLYKHGFGPSWSTDSGSRIQTGTINAEPTRKAV